MASNLVTLSRFDRDPPDAAWWTRRSEHIPASPSRVWRALTRPEELSRWWCDVASIDLRAGGRYAFGGKKTLGHALCPAEAAGAAANAPLAEDDEILDVEEEVRLRFRWKLFGVPTEVTYTLENYLELTRVTVLQTATQPPGWDPGPGPSWWSVALPGLRSTVEKGAPDLVLDYPALRGRMDFTLEAAFTTFPWVIWSKLTLPSELARWWAHAPIVELEAGGRYEWGLGDVGPRRILEIDEPRRLVHDWRWSSGRMSRVEWTLEETDDDVRVRVRHVANVDLLEPVDRVPVVWASALLALQSLSVRGVARDDPDSGV
jgi:uncharacterized protein YndB with AHSA1/START domain